MNEIIHAATADVDFELANACLRGRHTIVLLGLNMFSYAQMAHAYTNQYPS